MATKYSYLRMEPADNGVIVSWDEQTESLASAGQTYPNTTSQSRKHVFDYEEGENGQDNGIKAAMELFCKIASKATGKNFSYGMGLKDND